MLIPSVFTEQNYILQYLTVYAAAAEVCSHLIDDLDELHRGEGLSRSVLNGGQDLLLPLVPVADVVSDLGAGVLNHGSVACSRAPVKTLLRDRRDVARKEQQPRWLLLFIRGRHGIFAGCKFSSGKIFFMVSCKLNK